MNVYIVLEDGHVFCGKSFGYQGETTGELVFTTGMGGYIETLTDPSYFGQIVMQTFPLIGNYGYISEDVESNKSFVKAYIVKEFCENPSNFRCEKTLDEYLKEQKIIGIYDVDTREITKIIREAGVMNAKIVASQDKYSLKEISEYSIKDAVKNVSCEKETIFYPDNEKFNVGLLDFGAKKNIIRELVKRNCKVTVLPYNTSYEKLTSFDGIMLSNGPGDPEENIEIIENIKKIVGKLPIFGICLGHQILAIANGAKTEKLKYGHRGVNQPVKEIKSGRVYISSQNHGYAVIKDTLPEYATESYINVNDNTCEGVDYDAHKAFSVQFHPEACSGPKDSNFLFDRFIKLMEVK